jgi:hypothetical protein
MGEKSLLKKNKKHLKKKKTPLWQGLKLGTPNQCS